MTKLLAVAAAVLVCAVSSARADNVSGTDQTWGGPRHDHPMMGRMMEHMPRDMSGTRPEWFGGISGTDISGSFGFDQRWGERHHRGPWDISGTDVSRTRPEWFGGISGTWDGPRPCGHGPMGMGGRDGGGMFGGGMMDRDGDHHMGDCMPFGISRTDISGTFPHSDAKLFVLRYADGAFTLLGRHGSVSDTLPATPAYPLDEAAATQFCTDAGYSSLLGFNQMPKKKDDGEVYYISCRNAE